MTLSFQNLGLSHKIVDVVNQLGISQPTEIQAQAIPHVLAKKNVLAGAQTGTGKTAAFSLPIIQQFLDRPLTREINSRVIRALVLVPTRELAQQVFDNVTHYADQTGLKIVTAYGGTSMNVQTTNLKGGADILVATPGRLIDHLFCKNIVLSQTEVLVLDEADRMLDMGFMPDVQRILKRMNEARQTLFFSATLDQKIKAIANKMMSDSVEIQVAPANSTAETVKQMVYPVDKKRKSELLAYLIGSKNWQQVLVFTKTKQATDALVKELKLDGIKATSIHGDKSQGARQKALDDFKSGKVRALIATDVAARGLDIHQLPQVVNYDLPYKAEDYVHRIGRTGRAGATGLAVSLMSRDEEYLLKAIEDLLDTHLPQEWLNGFEPSLNDPIDNAHAPSKRGRSSEKQKMKAKLKIHAGRGKRR
ncbi:DEAD/DEAH box helicase [Vibrio genomosp. F10]|uniref:DEAD/DEAH box helicase n=2 Tax=Vibrio genomosp. F10 TaxID=723171 RepID=A0A1B9QYH2_9VIBR|nr:DEAD/DEAH box helicase [Vibrio genomosp. F10]OCH75505.1 DEAD/DEAH box helicase [Vibrio genomosp. F10]OEE31366.1 DEAD/DEAH box helicase [Vibrio genomosp. F10 str. ZF-129]OEE96464.1 DEAD/DEAH box helicase [Vibrio genomosp. F10 str. 9ZC157]OEE96889.1 DEAD/DEAH box helicase [Vibrio genomosp. F10 str. 9ZD137]OEF10583.1 DEAD/DEAH box helicase [Vibrio genomosp. F10 str. 9ZB36]